MSIQRSGNGQAIYPSTNYKKYEDSSFVAGDSPVVIDAYTDLGMGRTANAGYIAVDGPGSILVEIAKGDGSTYGEQFTLKQTEKFDLAGEGFRKIRLTHSGVDSAYRVFVE